MKGGLSEGGRGESSAVKHSDANRGTDPDALEIRGDNTRDEPRQSSLAPASGASFHLLGCAVNWSRCKFVMLAGKYAWRNEQAANVLPYDAVVTDIQLFQVNESTDGCWQAFQTVTA